MNKLRFEAEDLRAKGYSYGMINEVLGISKGTMSYWFHGKPFTPNKQALHRVRQSYANAATAVKTKKTSRNALIAHNAIKEIGALSDRDLFMLGLGLYIGEGTKSYETIAIANADPAVIQASVAWFTRSCGVPLSSIVVTMYIYPDSNELACQAYWQNVTGLPTVNFNKTQIDARTNKSPRKRGTLPYGTVRLHIRANGDRTLGRALFCRVKTWMDTSLNQV